MITLKCCCKVPLKAEIIQKTLVHICPKCGMITKDERLSFQEERIRYDAHHCDSRYLLYMEKVFSRIQSFFKLGLCLDYGCGQIHALADILNKQNIDCDFYDLHYYPQFPQKKYDTVILIEVFEHFYEPYDELFKIKALLNEGGRIIIMTQPYPQNQLDKWWYFRDVTHLNFIHSETFSFWKQDFKVIHRTGDIFVLESI